MEQNKHLPSKQNQDLENTQDKTLTKISDQEKRVLAASVFDINTLREFPLEPEEMEDWAVMIKKAVPDVNPQEIEDAILDLAKGKYDYDRRDGVRSLINAIQKNKGDNWYYIR